MQKHFQESLEQWQNNGGNNMREILFKAKRLDNGEWVEGNLILSNDAEEDYKTIIIPNTDADMFVDGCVYQDLGFEKWHIVDQSTICQYTGLTDKAKNKAFENSIIKVITDDEFGVIKYGEYANPFDNSSVKHIGFYVDWKNKTRTNLWRKDLGYWLNDTTIIVGNIFDNAELLEG